MMFKKNWSFLKKKKSLQTVKLRKVWAKQAKEMTEILVEKKKTVKSWSQSQDIIVRQVCVIEKDYMIFPSSV